MNKFNPVTSRLEPYPMEELTRIKGELTRKKKPIYDFGTGDPRIPTWAPIREAMLNAVPTISQYPSVKGHEELKTAQQGYLNRRFGINDHSSYDIIPTQGSKEAVFNIALCLVGRAGGKKHIIYPDPGYPVYRNSTLFAGGIPHPVKLDSSNGYLLEPWNLPNHIQRDAAAIWVNYPHNPTGTTVSKDYWLRLIEWGHSTDTIILSDDCYVDIYPSDWDEQNWTAHEDDDPRPRTPLQYSSKKLLSFMTLSKRSGMTGYRSGFVAGDKEMIAAYLRARANFGVGSPNFIQSAAVVAWNDDEHVAERRKIFAQRMERMAPVFQELGLLDELPQAAFYLWVRIPKQYGESDVKYCLALAEKGVISSPSQWLSESIKGYARFALVPNDEETEEAIAVIKEFHEKLK